MKNKKMTYVLGVLVLMVWGIIIYRIFLSVYHDDGNYKSNAINPAAKEPYNDYAPQKDTAKLLLNYRDPFSLVNKDTITRTEIKRPVTNAIKTLPQPGFNWGGIKYSGYIRNPGSKKLIAMLSINGKSTMLAEGEMAGDVKLLKNMVDSVKVSFKNQTKFIMMNNTPL